jgi:hypothetical protein
MSGVAIQKTRMIACVKHEDVIQYRPDILQNSMKTANSYTQTLKIIDFACRDTFMGPRAANSMHMSQIPDKNIVF